MAGCLPGPSDAWVSLAGLARETSRIRLGTLVWPVTFREPGPLAITVAQVDQMSGGRGQTYDHAGKHYTFTDSPALPKPAQQPGPPLIIGGGGKRRTPALAMRFAAEFNVSFRSVDATRAAFDRVLAGCDEAGRDRASLVLSIGHVLCVGRNEEELRRRADAIGRDVVELRETGFAGRPAEVVDRIGTFAEMGATRIYLQTLDLADLDHLQLVADEIAPQLT